MADDSADLVQQASRGDDLALDALLVRHLPRLRAFARLHLGPRLRAKESCSDIVQSACRQVLQGLDRFEYRDEASFRNWLCQSVLSKIRERFKHYRRDKRDIDREQDLEDDALAMTYMSLTTPSAKIVRREQQELFEMVFDRLPEDYRTVITFSRLVGLSHREVAREMGRNEGAVRMLLSRALARLGVELQAHQPEDHDPAE